MSKVGPSIWADVQAPLLEWLTPDLYFMIQPEFPGPKYCFLGDRFSGKTTIIQSILNAIMGPRFKYTVSSTTNRVGYIMRPGNPGKNSTVSLYPNNDASSSPVMRVKFPSYLHSKDMDSIFEQAAMLIQGSVQPTQHITNHQLKFTFIGAHGPYLWIWDVPGLVKNPTRDVTKQDIEVIKQIVENCRIKVDTRCIAVVPGTMDPAQSAIMEELSKGKSKHSVLGIVSKPDLINVVGLSDIYQPLMDGNDPMPSFLNVDWFMISGSTYPQDINIDSEAGARNVSSEQEIISLIQLMCLETQDYFVENIVPIRRTLDKKLQVHEEHLRMLGPGEDTPGKMKQDFTRHISRCHNRIQSGLTTVVSLQRPEPTGTSLEFRAAYSRARGREQFKQLISGTTLNNQDLTETVQLFFQRAGGQAAEGQLNPSLVHDIFKAISKHWHKETESYITNTLSILKNLVVDVLEEECPLYMQDSKLAEWIDSRFIRVESQSQAERVVLVTELYEDADNERCERLEQIWGELARQYPKSMEAMSVARLESVVNKYYTKCAIIYVSNVRRQIIGRHIVAAVKDMLSPNDISQLSDEKIKQIMLGSADTQRKRQQALNDKGVILKALETSDEFVRKANLARAAYGAKQEHPQQSPLTRSPESGKHSEHNNSAQVGMRRRYIKPVQFSEALPVKESAEPSQPNTSLKRSSSTTSAKFQEALNRPSDDLSDDKSSIMLPRFYSDSATGSMVTLARRSVDTFRS